jgi:hypothetical protein
MFTMGLSAKEITKTIDKIKEEYDHYIVRFGKTLEMKSAVLKTGSIRPIGTAWI